MAEKEHGGSSKVIDASPTPSPVTPVITTAPVAPATTDAQTQVPVSHTPAQSGSHEVARTSAREVPTPGGGWSAVWRQFIWDKWRWGVVLALALIVSRLSTA